MCSTRAWSGWRSASSRPVATPARVRERLRPAALLAGAAVVGHFLWNSPLLEFFPAHPWEGVEWFLIPLATAVKGLPLLFFVVLAIRLAHARERRWLRSTLATELGEEAVTPEELAILESRGGAPEHVGSCDAERGSAPRTSSGASSANR